jgi:protein-S-isoprenylcysteine O-methyltransferase Ste14
MSRIIEIVLFLTPFVGFFTWRLLFPSPLPPSWLIYGLAGFVGLLLLGLLWVWHIDASDANQSYVPAELRDGRVIQPRPIVPK